jgi:ribosomal RNA assembly protein
MKVITMASNNPIVSSQNLKIPLERVGALVGKEGIVKNEIEKRCGVTLEIDGWTGDVQISYGAGSLTEGEPFKAQEVITAIARGFSPQRAFNLFEEDKFLSTIDLRQFSGKSENSLARIKARLIGSDGKARKLIEQLSGTQISIYGHTVSIIGDSEKSKVAEGALLKIASGGTHKAAYQMLQKYRSKQKLERLQLWESQKPPEEREY